MEQDGTSNEHNRALHPEPRQLSSEQSAGSAHEPQGAGHSNAVARDLPQPLTVTPHLHGQSNTDTVGRKRKLQDFGPTTPPRQTQRIKSEDDDGLDSHQEHEPRRGASAFEDFTESLMGSLPPEQKFGVRDSREVGIHRQIISNAREAVDDAQFDQKRKSLVFDPYDKDNSWQILGRIHSIGRQKLAFALGFKQTIDMSLWEEDDKRSAQWGFIQRWAREAPTKLRVEQALKIICNDGGDEARVLAWLEKLKPWTWSETDALDTNMRRCSKFMGERDDFRAILRVSAMVVWLIRECGKQFPRSKKFGTPHFWYSPEDVGRAFWYLHNLQTRPDDRKISRNKPVKRIQNGIDLDRATLHNSVWEGEWAGRLAAKVVTKNAESPKEPNGQGKEEHQLSDCNDANQFYGDAEVNHESQKERPFYDAARNQPMADSAYRESRRSGLEHPVSGYNNDSIFERPKMVAPARGYDDMARHVSAYSYEPTYDASRATLPPRHHNEMAPPRIGYAYESTFQTSRMEYPPRYYEAMTPYSQHDYDRPNMKLYPVEDYVSRNHGQCFAPRAPIYAKVPDGARTVHLVDDREPVYDYRPTAPAHEYSSYVPRREPPIQSGAPVYADAEAFIAANSAPPVKKPSPPPIKAPEPAVKEQHAFKATTKQHYMLAQLDRLRRFAYTVLGSSIPEPVEMQIDTMIAHACSFIKTEKVKEFDDARMALRMFVCKRKLPSDITSDGAFLMPALEMLLRWAQDHPSLDMDAKDVALLFQYAAVAVGAGDDDRFHDLKVQIKGKVNWQEIA